MKNFLSWLSCIVVSLYNDPLKLAVRFFLLNSEQTKYIKVFVSSFLIPMFNVTQNDGEKIVRLQRIQLRKKFFNNSREQKYPHFFHLKSHMM